MRWPGNLAARREDLLIGAPDLMPTLLGMLGLGASIPADVEGADYSRTVLTGTGPRPDSAFYLRAESSRPWSGERGVSTHRWKLVIQRDDAGGQHTETRWLSDLQTDPLERVNHLPAHPEVEQELVARLNAWLAQTADPWAPIGRRE